MVPHVYVLNIQILISCVEVTQGGIEVVHRWYRASTDDNRKFNQS